MKFPGHSFHDLCSFKIQPDYFMPEILRFIPAADGKLDETEMLVKNLKQKKRRFRNRDESELNDLMKVVRGRAVIFSERRFSTFRTDSRSAQRFCAGVGRLEQRQQTQSKVQKEAKTTQIRAGNVLC